MNTTLRVTTLLTWICFSAWSPAAEKRPNIVFILADASLQIRAVLDQ